MAMLTKIRRAELADSLSRRGYSILRDAEAGMSNSALGRRFGVSGHTIAAFLSKERQRRHLAGECQLPETRPGSGVQRIGGAVALLSDGLLDDLAEAVTLEGTPAQPRPKQTWETTADGKPDQGDDSLPGYAAWELVHGAGMPVKDAMRRLGLRYPCQVYDLLAAHKRGLDGIRAQAAEANRTKDRPRVPCV